MLKHIVRSASAFISAFVLASGPSGGANARPPFFAIGEIYSNADGSVQFVKMNNVDSTFASRSNTYGHGRHDNAFLRVPW